MIWDSGVVRKFPGIKLESSNFTMLVRVDTEGLGVALEIGNKFKIGKSALGVCIQRRRGNGGGGGNGGGHGKAWEVLEAVGSV
jgi:hypothetical protein